MKKSVKFYIIFLGFLFNILCISNVYATDIIAENAIYYMKENNILDDSDYFYMFGKVLNGNDEYDITSFKYDITIEDDLINIDVTLMDKVLGEINRTTILHLEDGLISHLNTNETDSLESRIDTVIFNQLIYSIGGARGYDEDTILDWMNQIDLSTVTEDEGIDISFKNISYTTTYDGRTYEYDVSVPIAYIIDVNKVIDVVPDEDVVTILDVEPGISSVSMMVYSKEHSDEMCNIFRKNNDNKYELVGTVSCNNGEFTDIRLKDETTYYYQAAVVDKIMCSPETEVTTLKSPITGAFIPIFGLVILVAFGTALYRVYKKNKLFKRI